MKKMDGMLKQIKTKKLSEIPKLGDSTNGKKINKLGGKKRMSV